MRCARPRDAWKATFRTCGVRNVALRTPRRRIRLACWCIIFHVRIAVAGASGYAGGELLRLLLGASRGGDRRADGGRQRGHAAGCAPAAPAATGRPGARRDRPSATLAGHDVVFLALPHGRSAELAAAARRRRARDRLRRRPPAHRPRRLDPLVRRRARRCVALRPARAARRPRRPARRAPDRRARAATRRRRRLALFPALAAGLAEPEVVVTAVSRHVRAPGKSLKPHLLGAEVMGALSAYGVGGVHRHTPEIVQNLSVAAGRTVGVSFTPVLAPLPRGILATCTARTDASAAEVVEAYAKAYADEPFVHLLPEGVWPTTAATLGANTVHLQVTVDPDARPPGRRRRDRQPHQGHRRRRRAVHEPRPRPPRGHRPAADGSGAVSITAPQGFRAAGVAAGIKYSGALDLALVVNDGPATPPPACSPATRSRPRPCSGRSRCSPAGGCAPSSSTPAAPTRAPGRRASRRPTPPRRRRPRSLGCGAVEVAVCSTGHHRRAAARGPPCSPGSRRPPRSSPPTPEAAAAAATAVHHHRHRRQAGRARRRPGWRSRRHRQGRRHDRPVDGHDARRAHHRRRGRRRRVLTRRCARPSA